MAIEPKPSIAYSDFQKLDLRVGKVVEAVAHPNADRLVLLQVDLGGETRQLVAGLKEHYEAEQLVGRQIVVIVNLEPRTMRGQTSHGMLLAAVEGEYADRVVFLTPESEVAPGTAVS